MSVLPTDWKIVHNEAGNTCNQIFETKVRSPKLCVSDFKQQFDYCVCLFVCLLVCLLF